ncbi:MAG: hypothetical protein HYZ89_00155, partial [Candidatus Omnitrophica bacterium]|nr:hypothetical protein [Candidatus Omnitrophota bacterium]
MSVIVGVWLSLMVPACAGPHQGSGSPSSSFQSASSTTQQTESPKEWPEPESAHRVDVRGEWLSVDGEPFLVKGVGYSPSRPGQLPWTSQVRPEVMADDFVKIREAGFNTLRTWAPLSPDQLALARRHGLMVLQGIWVDPKGNYHSDAFQETILKTILEEVERAKRHDNVLAFLVGNELLPERAFLAGLDHTRALLKQMYATAKHADPTRLVSYANWPLLSMLDVSFWDVVSFNLYPYEPTSVSHSFGFRGYIEHLKQTVAREKPLIITEVGLSVSPTPSPHVGYGGYTPEQQATEVVKLWDAAFQGGAQGACVFEWNDEWWKQDDYNGDERIHDSNDPEEWFGLTEFSSFDQVQPTPRPVYAALKAYNQAILVSPVSGASYAERLPVSVYATDAVASIRVRVGQGKWQPAIQVSPHWWKLTLSLPLVKSSKSQMKVVMEARDQKGRRLIQQERFIDVKEPRAHFKTPVARSWELGAGSPPIDSPQLLAPRSQPRGGFETDSKRAATITLETDHDRYEAGHELQSMRYVVKVGGANGQPVVDQQVDISIAELQAKIGLVQSKQTDQEGKVEGTYLLREPGLVTIAAGIMPDHRYPERRIGAERTVGVEPRQAPLPQAALTHHASPWEARVPKDIQQALRRHDTPAFQLADPGTEQVVDYARYGHFHDVGTPHYRYEIVDREGLAAAVGEGIYPNEKGLLNDAAYRKALQEGALEGRVWDFTDHPDAQRSFLKWASFDEESPGVKQFFAAMALERAGLLQAAVKAYYAVLVHFPEAVGWTEFQTPWYVGRTARDKIEAIVRLHPELGLRLEGAQVIVEHGFDFTVDNDVISSSPGQLVRVAPEAVNPPSTDVLTLAVKRELGKGRVKLRQHENGHWQLLVEGKPWVIRGVSYSIAAVGESHDEGTYKDWMTADRNQNKTLDVFETFVDANRNNRHDPD